MKTTVCAVFFFLSMLIQVKADETVRTEDGREIILRSDGTYTIVQRNSGEDYYTIPPGVTVPAGILGRMPKSKTRFERCYMLPGGRFKIKEELAAPIEQTYWFVLHYIGEGHDTSLATGVLPPCANNANLLMDRIFLGRFFGELEKYKAMNKYAQ